MHTRVFFQRAHSMWIWMSANRPLSIASLQYSKQLQCGRRSEAGLEQCSTDAATLISCQLTECGSTPSAPPSSGPSQPVPIWVDIDHSVENTRNVNAMCICRKTRTYTWLLCWDCWPECCPTTIHTDSHFDLHLCLPLPASLFCCCAATAQAHPCNQSSLNGTSDCLLQNWSLWLRGRAPGRQGRPRQQDPEQQSAA
jgi:hypothetical protein